MNEYIKALLKSTIPTALIFIGRSDDFFNFLIRHKILIDENTNIEAPKLTAFLVGLSWAGLVVPVQYEKLKKKVEKKENKFSSLLGIYKETYINSVKEKLNISTSQINTRVFVRKKDFKSKIKFWWNDEIYFELKEIKGISDSINVEKLVFKVSPEPEGLIGEVFKNNNPIMDLSITPEKYKLTSYQKSKTSDIKFCCVAPIHDEQSNIVAMISLDSTKKIKLLPENTELWNELIQDYYVILDKFINQN
jgi:hypothetical protein